MKRFISCLIVFLSIVLMSSFVYSANELCFPEDNPYCHQLNSNNMLSSMTFITKDKVYMTLYSGISVSDYIRLSNDVIRIRDLTPFRTIHLTINSPGGSAFDGLSLADMIERAQREWGFTFKAYATGIVASAAVPVFAVCKERQASQGVMFMVHEAALWKWPGRESKSDILAQAELMNRLQDLYLGFLVRNTHTSRKAWEKMEKKTTWFGREDAERLGLLTRKTGGYENNGQ